MGGRGRERGGLEGEGERGGSIDRCLCLVLVERKREGEGGVLMGEGEGERGGC